MEPFEDMTIWIAILGALVLILVFGIYLYFNPGAIDYFSNGGNKTNHKEYDPNDLLQNK